MIGSFGDVVFSVSREQVQTIKNVKWKSSVSYAKHKVHGKDEVLELTGYASGQISFEIELSAFLGVNPTAQLQKLEDMMRQGVAKQFILGTTVIGRKWVIQALNRDLGYVYRDGTLLSAKASLTLYEAEVS